MAHAGKMQWLLHLLFMIVAGTMILPLILVFMVSITDETTILRDGYSFFPKHLSYQAYHYLFLDSMTIIRAYGVTIYATVVGSIGGLLLTSLLAYPISRNDLPFRKSLSFFIFFTLLFNGGLVPWYLVFTQIFNLKDTIWALIVPGLLLNGFFVLIMRTFFQTTIHPALIESARIDGAGELRILFRLILPLSLPVIATMALFSTINYWNDWFNALLFIRTPEKYPLQYLMMSVLNDVQFLRDNIAIAVQNPELLRNLPSESLQMALAVVGMGPILLVYPFFQRYFVQGLTVGAVKG